MKYKALHPKDDIDCMCQEKEKEFSPAVRIAKIHQYKDSNTTFKKAKKD